eukprot:13965644-Alexandrium_andersonii.AAC.1
MLQSDIRGDSMKGDAIHERGSLQDSVQGFVRGSMRGDSVQPDTHVDSMKGDCLLYTSPSPRD